MGETVIVAILKSIPSNFSVLCHHQHVKNKTLFSSILCNSNKLLQLCVLFLFSLSLHRGELAITLYHGDLRSNLREYRKSGTAIEVDEVGGVKMWLDQESKLQHFITK